MSEWLARRLLEDREQGKAREIRQRRERAPGIEFDPFQTVRWRRITGPDPGYLPKIPMRLGGRGGWINCRACGRKFESIGLAYCEACVELPADERRLMRPIGRECQAPGCGNVIAPTARVDARYCSTACRVRASRAADVTANSGNGLDIGAGQNVTDSGKKNQ
jgi:hypothetical protein